MTEPGTAATWRVPGRIEVLGKHTDYAGGNVLVCAADRAVTATAGRGDGPGRAPGPVLLARSSAVPDTLALGAGTAPDLPPGHWGRYVATAWHRLRSNFGELPPLELTVDADLPLASGMSSSSALVVASTLALVDAAGLRDTALWRTELGEDRLRWALYLAAVENGVTFGALAGHAGVGTRGGSEDHVAMLCSRPGHLGQFGFAPPVRHRDVPLPDGWTFVVAVSGVSAEKTGPAQTDYNRASAAIAEALRRWNDHTGRRDATLAAALRADDDAADLLFPLLPEQHLSDRVEQFRIESEELVPAGADALAVGDLDAFGEVAAASQHLAETLLGNQVPETIALAATARELGAAAASAFGAGFGGSVWALVPASDAESFASAWLSRFTAAFPHRAGRASTLISGASAPARPVAGASTHAAHPTG